jgi:succinyl-CoA synthetase beta subunit
LYAGFSADGSDDLPTLLLSHEGGADIEDVPPEKIATEPVNPLIGMQPFHLQNAIASLAETHPDAAADIPDAALETFLLTAWELFDSGDLRVLEVNPLGIDGDDLVAMDAKMIPDEAARYRQDYRDSVSTLEPLEEDAAADGIELRVGEGSVGIISNGAGMGLATLDLVERHPGGGLAGFIDTHGAQFDWDDIPDFLSYLERADSQVVIVNVIGPFLDCSKIASELAAAAETGYDVPIVARFKGLEHEAALQTCADADIPVEREVLPAVERAVAYLDGGTA